ncbi:MAG TPA: BatB protein, partial [Rudaea sp.]|nr:BatB protein [Rudaea sp.]
MLEFAWPWLFVLLPLPWLLARLLPPARDNAGAALRLPYALDGLDAAAGAAPVATWRKWFALAAWALLVGATARPQWLGPPQDVARSGRDLLFAVD